MKKFKYHIINLDCANCALKIEEALNKNPELRNVSVNFTTQNITYETDNIDLIKLNRLVSAIEPDVKVVEKIESKSDYYLLPLGIALVLYLIVFIVKMPDIITNILLLIAYFLLLYKPLVNALKSLIKSHSINENMLITISAMGAFLIDKKMEGLMVVLLYDIGKYLEEKALNNSRQAISDIVSLKQDYANIVKNKNVTKIAVEDIKLNDLLLVKKGEKVPVDGILVNGTTFLDTSALTGESIPVSVNPNSHIISGSLNLGNPFMMQATTTYEDSTVAKVLDLVMNATDKKAHTETLVAKISKYYTPIVMLGSLLVIIVLTLMGLPFSTSLYRGLTFLVISCPCAIAISVPLSYFTGIGVCSKQGILVKGSNYLDNLSKLDALVFDKTGTITNGQFKVTQIIINDSKYSEKTIKEIVSKGESLSLHPLALAMQELCPNVDNHDVKNFEEITGEGISYNLGKDHIIIGTAKICNCQIDANIHVNINKHHVASIIISDEVKSEAKGVINNLKKLKIKTYLLTGDKQIQALTVAKQVGITNVEAEVLPQEKYQLLDKLKQQYKIVGFVGDGINDAPVLKLADVGISMGKIGSNMAIEASDIVIMQDNLTKIIQGIKISKKTNDIIKEDLIFAIGTKIIILILSVFGLTTMWMAVFADTGVTLLAILNTLRITK
jgi:Zn2+/Cd2+-exporting ATPase